MADSKKNSDGKKIFFFSNLEYESETEHINK